MIVVSEKDSNEALGRIRAGDPSLTKLELISMMTDDEKLIAIVTALATDGARIKTLTLKHPFRFTPGRDVGLIKAVVDVMNRNQSLSTLYLYKTSFGDDERGEIASALRNNRTLKEFRMILTNVGEKGAGDIAEVLRHNKTLEVLKLGGNSFGNCGVSTIINCLQNNSTLKTLHLNNNRIGTKGALAIADVIRDNITLEDLDLGSNSFGSDGGVAIARSLLVNKSIKKLSMPHTSIRTEGAKAMAKVIAHNTVLKDLNLDYNYSIDEDGFIAIATALRANVTLEKLSMVKDNLGENIWEAFHSALEKNSSLQELNPLLSCPARFKEKISHELDFNRTNPVEAEVTKTGVFPRRFLSGNDSPPCFVETVVKVLSFQNLSVAYTFFREQPNFFTRHKGPNQTLHILR